MKRVNNMISFFEILGSINAACDNFDNPLDFLEVKRDLEDLIKFACMGYEWIRPVYNDGGEKLWVLEKYKNVKEAGEIVDFDSENYIVVGYELGKLVDDIMRGKECI